ncbi:hypothetical protein B0A49_04583 [Cryomyces minteri]|uniref:Uncharacterized protein n=1 Tax=Cryomyces minteri TaxID=331657 RepID=A0A4U0WW93_9PEZI|nr:hypothetical protein B0A49_04583 [Cryomyces minteri]
MGFLKLTSLALLLLQAFTTFAQIEVESIEEEIEDPSQTPDLKVTVSASFPQSEIFGIKLINGHPTQAVLSFTNNELAPVTVGFVGGSLWTPDTPGQPTQIVRNLTSTRYNVEVPVGQSESLTYSFATELHPQDLRLNLAALVSDAKGSFYAVQAFNETVSVVEAPTSFFDPQIIFLYVILAAAFGGTCYFIYNTWIASLFPQKRRGGKGGERAKRSSGQSKKVDPADQVSVVGADGPAVTSGAKAYDESWIPAHHINRPEAKRINSGAKIRPKSRAT